MWLAYSEISHPPASPSISGSHKYPCGWGSLCDDTHPSDSLYIGKPERSLWLAYSKISISLLLSISGSPKDPCGWPMRRYPCPSLSQYREALKILVAGLCEDTHPIPFKLLSISGSPKDPCGWPIRSYPSPLLLPISGSHKYPCGWPMRRYPSPCFSLYREGRNILVAGLCEDTHPLLLSI